MNIAAAEAATVAAAAATLLPGECWAACVGFAGTFCLSLCSHSLFTPLSVFCFVLCFCCFWVVALGDSACEALSQSALSPLSPLSLPALLACVRTLSLSPFLSLLLSLVPLPFCLRASAVRLFVASVLWHARQDWQRSSSAVGQQASEVSQSVANAAGARISTSSQATLPTSSQSLTHAFRALFSRQFQLQLFVANL